MSDNDLSVQDKKKLQALIDELDSDMEALALDIEKLQKDVTNHKHKQDIKQVLDNILSLKE